MTMCRLITGLTLGCVMETLTAVRDQEWKDKSKIEKDIDD